MKIYDENTTRKYYELGAWDNKLFQDYVKEYAEKTPDREAIVDQPNKEELIGVRPYRLTWKEYSTLIDRLALNFLEFGIKAEDVVFTFLPNCVEFAVVHLALARIGAVGTYAPMRYRDEEVVNQIRLSEAKYAISMGEFRGFNCFEMVKNLHPQCPSLKGFIGFGKGIPKDTPTLQKMLRTKLEVKYPADYLDQYRNSPDDLLNLCITTGTEALSKLVPRTQNNWKIFVRPVLKATGHDSDTVFCSPFPLVNMGGLGVGFYLSVLSGGKFVIHEPFDVDIWLKQITEEKMNYFIAVNFIYNAMLNHPELDTKYDISSLTVTGCGGEPPAPWIVEAMDNRGITIIDEFGSTEGWAFFSFASQALKDRQEQRFLLAKIKEMIPGYEVKCVEPKTLKEVPVGTPGELAVKGPNVLPYYWNAPEVNKRDFAEGFFFSGDLVKIDQDNTLTYESRIKDMIIRSGQNIAPAEIEGYIQKHPKVFDVGVIGIPDPERGEKVCACVSLKDKNQPITLEEIRSFMREQKIASFKIPERLEILDELPMGPSRKLDKKVLRAEVKKRIEAEP